MNASEFLDHLEKQRKNALAESMDEKDHSLQGQAKERAKHPSEMNAGTAFDWEDLDDYKKELQRMDREGSRKSGSPRARH